jgi:hypothetical protein
MEATNCGRKLPGVIQPAQGMPRFDDMRLTEKGPARAGSNGRDEGFTRSFDELPNRTDTVIGSP